MNIYLIIAGVLCNLLGIFHSVLGEHLIFRHNRIKGKLVPSKSESGLSKRHLGIVWASWHLVSIFGWALGAILIKIAFIENTADNQNIDFILKSIIYAILTSSFLVMIGTKRKHPGWFVLLIIGILIMIGN